MIISTQEEQFFVLAKTQTTKLCYGFRYTKALLIQLHNLSMQEAFDKLSRSGITVFSVKTECFTIKPDDLERRIPAWAFSIQIQLLEVFQLSGSGGLARQRTSSCQPLNGKCFKIAALSSSHTILNCWISLMSVTRCISADCLKSTAES